MVSRTNRAVSAAIFAVAACLVTADAYGDEQAYQNCVSMGYAAESCARTYLGSSSPQADGTSGPVVTNSTQAYQNCVSMGYGDASCTRTYLSSSSPQADGAGGADDGAAKSARYQKIKDGLIATAAVLVVAGIVYAAVKSGGGGGSTAVNDYQWDWDVFYNEQGQLAAYCRGVQTGQFADEWHCNGLPVTDARWPGK